MFPIVESICGQLPVNKFGLPLTLFFAGVTGSFTHCMTMCSPFVLQQIAVRPDAPKGGWANQLKALLVPYHMGRLTTYTFIGVVAAMVSSQVMAFKAFHYVSAVLLVLAAMTFLATALSATSLRLPFNFCGVPKWIVDAVSPLFVSDKFIQKYLLGLILGFIPCGLVFAAVMAVAASADPLLAFGSMILFSVGTIPGLLMVTLGGRFAFVRYSRFAKPVSAALMAVNSFVLFLMAGEWIV